MLRWALGLLACALLAGCGGDGDEKERPCTCPDGRACATGGDCPPASDADGDGDGVADGRDECPDTAPGAVVNRRGCLFEEEGQGSGVRQIAGDFTLQTLDGPFSFRESWTGLDSHVFYIHLASDQMSQTVWSSDPAGLLADSLPNVYYHFLSAAAGADERRADVEELRDRFETALGNLDGERAAHWRGRLHFVTDDIRSLDGALGAFFAGKPIFGFAIDRFQRWREVGLLYDWVLGTFTMRFLANEVAGFEYELRLARELAALRATEVVVFDGERHAGGWEAGYATTVEIELPSREEMARFDSMAVHLYTACPNHRLGVDEGCNEWDYAHHLFLCDAEDPSRCDTELVRYVTPYGREGEWLTDVSPLLPLLAEGGKRTLRYEGANGYEMHLRILFWDAGKSHRPVEATFLWGASGPIPWNAAYNGRFEPVRFTVENPAATRMEIYSVVTGHGFGSTNENCAEFCDSEHQFAVNGTTFSEKHPEARRPYGCLDAIDQGVVPNQLGSWPFGRAGWCPGLDVKPWVQDVSDVLVSGENEIAYRALYRGEPYDPLPNGQGDYMPELRFQSWLVRYEAR